MKWILTGLVAMTATFKAMAIPTGEIAIVGLFTPSGGTGLADATSVNFSDSSLVVGATGSFADYLTPFVSQAEIASFQFDPFSSPVDPLWSAGGFEFRLDTISVEAQTDGYLVLSGAGVLNGNGFVNTPGTWDFAGFSSGIFLFRSDETVVLSGFLAGGGGEPEPSVGVPDGGNTLLFLGAILMGLLGSMTWLAKRRTAGVFRQ